MVLREARKNERTSREHHGMISFQQMDNMIIITIVTIIEVMMEIIIVILIIVYNRNYIKNHNIGLYDMQQRNHQMLPV